MNATRLSFPSLLAPALALALSACGAPDEAAELDATAHAQALTSQSGEVIVTQTGALVRSSPSQHVVFYAPSAGAAETVLAGKLGVAGSVDGLGGAARLSAPSGLGYDPVNNFVYVADRGSGAIRRINIATGRVTTTLTQAAALGAASASGYPIPSWSIEDIAVHPTSGALYFSDYGNSLVWRSVAGALRPLAGLPGAPGLVNAVGTAARFNRPSTISIASGSTSFFPNEFTLLVADTANAVIRAIRLSDATVATVGPLR